MIERIENQAIEAFDIGLELVRGTFTWSRFRECGKRRDGNGQQKG
ncbi:MAG: hypothetical protein WBP11_07075 [Dokdonella sp.]